MSEIPNFSYMANEVNYIVSSLPAYVKEFPELISKQLAFGTPTVRRLTPQTGIKTSARINFLNVNVPLQNGIGCGFTPSGTAELTNRTIVTAILKKEIKVCPDTLMGKWPEYEVRVPADQRDNLPFEAYLVAEIIAETNEQLETLVWQGDTVNGTGDLALIDGFLAIASAEAGTVDVTIPAGSSALKAVRAVIAAAPAKLLRHGFKVFVSPEDFTALAFELVDANLYHFNPGAPVDSLILPGTNVEVINAPGLSGTDYMFGSLLKNMYYGTDVEGAENRVKIVYDEINDYFAVKFRWNSGVQVAFPDWCVLAEKAGSIVSPDGDAALAAIAAGVSELADADHVYKTDEQA